MNPQIDAIIARARLEADRPQDGTGTAATERQRLERMASEFESMLLVQVLRDMRRAGRWDEGEGEGDSTNTQSLFEMLDVELASHLTRAQGFGLTKQLMDAFDRMGTPGDTAVAALTALVPGPDAARDMVLHQESHPESVGAAPVGHPLASDITSAFGWRKDPLTGETRFHRGVDLRAAYGQDVPAAQPGTVVSSGDEGSYGTTVLVQHANGTRSRYAHLSVAFVKAGDSVQAGQTIGQAGRSGRATGPHLHFEMLERDGTPVDPMR